MNTIHKENLMIILELIAACLIGIEVSFNPNPYIEELIIVMTIYIVLKHDIVEKILDTLDKFFIKIWGWTVSTDVNWYQSAAEIEQVLLQKAHKPK